MWQRFNLKRRSSLTCEAPLAYSAHRLSPRVLTVLRTARILVVSLVPLARFLDGDEFGVYLLLVAHLYPKYASSTRSGVAFGLDETP